MNFSSILFYYINLLKFLPIFIYLNDNFFLKYFLLLSGQVDNRKRHKSTNNLKSFMDSDINQTGPITLVSIELELDKYLSHQISIKNSSEESVVIGLYFFGNNK